jgi:invasion protein IalB
MRLCLTCLVTAAGLLMATAGWAVAQQITVKATHGDWQIQCPENVSDTNPCAMVQELINEQDRRILSAIILHPAGAEPFLRIIVPLGVLLPGGMTLKIDAADVGTVGFINCLPDGCMTQVGLTADVLEQLKQGNQATVVIYEQTDKPIQLPLSLAGFTAAYGEL